MILTSFRVKEVRLKNIPMVGNDATTSKAMPAMADATITEDTLFSPHIIYTYGLVAHGTCNDAMQY